MENIDSLFPSQIGIDPITHLPILFFETPKFVIQQPPIIHALLTKYPFLNTAFLTCPMIKGQSRESCKNQIEKLRDFLRIKGIVIQINSNDLLAQILVTDKTEYLCNGTTKRYFFCFELQNEIPAEILMENSYEEVLSHDIIEQGNRIHFSRSSIPIGYEELEDIEYKIIELTKEFNMIESTAQPQDIFF